MSTVSRDDAIAALEGNDQRSENGVSAGSDETRAPETLGSGWVVFYLITALTISWLYYCNSGFWELVRHARQWLRWVCDL